MNVSTNQIPLRQAVMQSVIGLLDFSIRVIRVLVNLENSADLHSLISIDKQQQQQENIYPIVQVEEDLVVGSGIRLM